jgi:DNA-binding winged helix-turn-helix (wHTH) protein/tetratricopeptide (TPR) repeat protein
LVADRQDGLGFFTFSDSPMATKPRVLYEFGPFRVDPDKQVLLRESQPVPITPKAFETLLILVQHSREVVTKDELMKAVWPDAFVEEANLSQNIFRLRKALGDSPEDRQYIVTLPGRGYRFAAEVRTVTQDGEDVVMESRSSAQVIVDQPDAALAETLTRSLPAVAIGWKREPSRKHLSITGALLALAAVAVAFYLHSQRQIAFRETDTVLIADFANNTGDAVFDGTLRQGLAVQLEQSPFLSLVSEDRIQQTLRMMGQVPDARLTPQVAREVCERTASAAVLEGSIASLGSQYVLGLRAKNCVTGEVLDEEQVQAAKKEDVLDALSKIAGKFRSRVGESLAAVAKHDTPLAEATTPSLEALKVYSAALKLHASNGDAAALPLFKRATEIDPQFAIAYAFMGFGYESIGESALTMESISKAYELRDRASDGEKFFITAAYDLQVTGNLEKAEKTCELWAETYPRELTPHGFLSGIIYPILGKYEPAMENARKTVEIDPDFGIGYNNLAIAYEALDRLGEAADTLRQASERKLELPDFLVDQYQIAFLKGDHADMERVVAAGKGTSGEEALASEVDSFGVAYYGHLQEARKKSRRAVELAQQSSQRGKAALYEAGAAVREAVFGNAPAARRSAAAVLELSNGRDGEYGAALAWAVSGDSAEAQKLADDLEKRFPESTALRFGYLPTLRAQVALNHGETTKAIETLQTAVPYELGQPPCSFFGFFGPLYPVYVRGEAYLAAHQGAEAVAEFQKILDHRGVVVTDPIGALIHLQLGRAFALSGERSKAKAAYSDFFTLWEDADPDIPVLRQAKAEYAKLH